MVLVATRFGQGVDVARTRRRVAAGAAMFAAVVSIGGPGVAAAPADPGHGGSNRDRGSGDGGGDGRGHKSQRDGSRNDSGGGDRRGRGDREREDRSVDRGDRGDRRGVGGRGPGDDGRRHEGRSDSGKDDTGRSRADDADDADDAASGSGTASRGTGGSVSARGVAAESESVGVQSVDPPTAAPSTGDGVGIPPVVVATGGAGGSVAGGAPIAFERPAVVFGNGRTPGVLSSGRAGAQAPVEAGEPAVAAVPEAAIAPVVIPPSPPTALPNVAADDQLPRFVSEAWSPIGPGDNSGALFGVAGLLLIPLAGIWLGYRQALAARAVAGLSER